MATPTKAPKDDSRCWPHPCRDYHETWSHLEGDDPCECPCHVKLVTRFPGDTPHRARLGNASDLAAQKKG